MIFGKWDLGKMGFGENGFLGKWDFGKWDFGTMGFRENEI